MYNNAISGNIIILFDTHDIRVKYTNNYMSKIASCFFLLERFWLFVNIITHTDTILQLSGKFWDPFNETKLI